MSLNSTPKWIRLGFNVTSNGVSNIQFTDYTTQKVSHNLKIDRTPFMVEISGKTKPLKDLKNDRR